MLGATLAALAVASTASTASPPQRFVVQVLDAQTGDGVPLIWLETTSHLRTVTDSNGPSIVRTGAHNLSAFHALVRTLGGGGC